eukprot:scaffold46260_cov42-Phaeocystis_antarctica.AAC.1
MTNRPKRPISTHEALACAGSQQAELLRSGRGRPRRLSSHLRRTHTAPFDVDAQRLSPRRLTHALGSQAGPCFAPKLVRSSSLRASSIAARSSAQSSPACAPHVRSEILRGRAL